MGSWKLESGVDKEDIRVKKKGDLKNKEKKNKTIVKHERGIVIILTFEFEHINRLLFSPLFFILKANQLILNMRYFSLYTKMDIFLYLDAIIIPFLLTPIII